MWEKCKCLLTLWEKVNAASGIYANPIEIPIIRKNQFHVLWSLEFGKRGWFLYFCKNQSSDILQHSQNRPTGDRWLKF